MANATDGAGRDNGTPQGASSLAIKGMFTPVLAKHTKNFGLQDSISIWVDARLKQVEGLLPGDDLCRFPGGRKPRGWESRYLAVLLVPAVQAADPRAAVPVPGKRLPAGHVKSKAKATACAGKRGVSPNSAMVVADRLVLTVVPCAVPSEISHGPGSVLKGTQRPPSDERFFPHVFRGDIFSCQKWTIKDCSCLSADRKTIVLQKGVKQRPIWRRAI
jgi:hypothetical protein